MKRETQEEKLNRMLGLAPEKVQEVKTRSSGRVVGVTEEEIQQFREAQGLLYFFKAPELFTHKVCKHCGEGFLVSRKYVGFCSYTCIKNELEKDGIVWRKGKDIEALVADVYEGNEPVWLRSRVLNKLLEMVSKPPTENAVIRPLTSSEPVAPVLTSPPSISKSEALAALGLGPTSESTTVTQPTTSSVSTTTSTSTNGGSTSSKSRGKPRRIISPPS